LKKIDDSILEFVELLKWVINERKEGFGYE